MGLGHYLKHRLTLLREAESLKEKFYLFEYFIKYPFQNHKYLFKKEILLKTKYGLFNGGREISGIWTVSSAHDPSVHKFLKHMNKGVFIDVGAHYGSMSIQVGKQMLNHGKIIAIEPEPSYYNMLLKNIKLNRLNNIVAIQNACSNKKGKIDITWYLLGRKKTKKIETVTIDEIVKKFKLKIVDIIKIDVEGMEDLVIEGARKTIFKYKPQLLFEANNAQDFKKVNNLLSQLDYKVKKMDKNNYLGIYIKRKV
ncbi:MAG TPA: FkbM family methyltransferase [Candidatus Nanoarchaeia archaeon]|nr:FkbM family methyltransferase [Candidatus Nanoarchaeia archaeon]